MDPKAIFNLSSRLNQDIPLFWGPLVRCGVYEIISRDSGLQIHFWRVGKVQKAEKVVLVNNRGMGA